MYLIILIHFCYSNTVIFQGGFSMSNINDLFALCQGHKVYIQTHNFPDPDAIASAYGMQQLFKHKGIESVICHEGQIDKLSARKMLDLCNIEMVPNSELVNVMKPDDYILLVDCQKHNGNTVDMVGDEIAVVDHHPTFYEVEYKYKDVRIVGACSSIVASYYKDLGIEPDTNTATTLLYGMKMDTLQFTRGLKTFDIDMFSFLFSYVDNNKLASLERNNLEFDDLRAYGTAIENVKVFGRTGFTVIDYPCPDAMIGIISDFILSLVEIDVAVVSAERVDGIKYSIRSERIEVDAGELAYTVLSEYGNGGGHAAMAGGFISNEVFKSLGNHPHEVMRDKFLAKIPKLD